MVIPVWVDTRGSGDRLEVRLKTLMEFRPMFEQPGEFLLIQGEEISDRAEGKPVHMNATNIQQLIQPLGGKTVGEAITNNFRAVEDQARKKSTSIRQDGVAKVLAGMTSIDELLRVTTKE